MNAVKKIQLIVSLLLLFIMQGCSSTDGFSKFYISNSSEKYTPTDRVDVYGYSEDSVRNLQKDGYVSIGYSSFNGPLQNPEHAVSLAKQKGANVVLVKCEHTETVQGTIPMPQYHAPQTTTVTTYNSGSVNANVQGYAQSYGSSGYVNTYGHGSGSATYSGTDTSYITTPGYTTYNNMPYIVARYDQMAVFFRKIQAGESTSAFSKKPASGGVEKLFALYKKANNTLTKEESIEFAFSKTSSPRYHELRQRAINNLPADEKESFLKLENELKISP